MDLNNPILKAALDYHAKGYSIIPMQAIVETKDKVKKIPSVKEWKSYQTKRANEEQIIAWWRKSPNALIGVVCGKISGIIGIDTDSAEADQEFQELLPENITVPVNRSPRGGKHYVFQYQDGIQNSSKPHSFEVKSDGSILIFPPSKIPDGRKYEWLENSSLDDIPLPVIPSALFERIKGNGVNPTSYQQSTTAKENERLSRIMACEFMKHCSQDRENLSEPEWYAAVSNLAPESGGVNLIHSISIGNPGYSRKETEAKIIHSLRDGGPATCERIKMMYDCGKNCHVKSPIVLAQRQGETEGQKPNYLTLNLPSSLEISRLEIKVDWIVKNLIPKESITLLHSIGGVGKSYLLYGIAKAVADGELFFGLEVMRIPVYYIDFENPLPEIVDRMKKMGGSENLKIWHLSHNPAPIRFDADEWGVYKTFPPGLFIIDSLRSSHLLEENSSKDAGFIMARHKEIRAIGNTIILIHHENKIGGYRGSTAWFDLSDHILKFSRVKTIGSDEDAEEDNFDLPIRLGLGGKSRFSSAMELKPIYFKFENHQLCRAEDPEEEVLKKMAGLLDPGNPPNQSEFQKLVKQNLGIGAKDFRKLLKRGEGRHFWFAKKSATGNKLEYFRGQK